jgi:hypothetical protein
MEEKPLNPDRFLDADGNKRRFVVKGSKDDRLNSPKAEKAMKLIESCYRKGQKPNFTKIQLEAGYTPVSAVQMAIKKTQIYKRRMPQIIATMEAIRNKANEAILNRDFDAERITDLAVISKIFTHDSELLKGNSTEREEKAVILPEELTGKNNLLRGQEEKTEGEA